MPKYSIAGLIGKSRVVLLPFCQTVSQSGCAPAHSHNNELGTNFSASCQAFVLLLFLETAFTSLLCSQLYPRDCVHANRMCKEMMCVFWGHNHETLRTCLVCLLSGLDHRHSSVLCLNPAGMANTLRGPKPHKRKTWVLEWPHGAQSYSPTLSLLCEI